VADLVKRHPALFLPYVAADLLAICIWRLRGLAEKGIFQWFTTKHSVLGGPVSSTRLDPDTFAKAAIAYTPIGIGSIIAVVWLFVAALVWTAVMVDVFENEQRPDARDILTRVVARWRTILLFALRFLLTFGVFSAVTGGLTYSLLFLVHRQEFLTSYWLVAGMMVLPVGGAAWLVMPAALRLLGEDASATVATKTKLQGTILALAAMEAGVALGFLLSNLEGPMLINSQ
jgi:hypothetical protein